MARYHKTVVSDIDMKAMQSILDALPIGVYLLDKDHRLIWVNTTLNRHFADKKGHLQYRGKECYRYLFKKEIPCMGCPALKTIESSKIEYMEMEAEHRYYLIAAIPLERVGDNKDGLFIIETIQDITHQKRAEEELKRLNDFNAAIIENAPVAIFTIDRTGKFMSVNPALAILSGLGVEAEEKLLRFNWIQNPYTINCGLAEHIKKGLEGEAFELQDFPFTDYRGDRGQYIHFRGVPLRGKDGHVECLLCIIEDNTEKVKAKIQSIQDAKMSVIGRLTTGVAHELNNPLATIAANSELASELFQDLKEGDIKGDIRDEYIEELQGYLDVIQQQAFRCKNIIKDMIDLTKKEGFEPVEIDLNQCLDELLTQINFEKLNITLSKEIAPGLPYVRGDLNAIKQCFMNIIQNAVDAVEGREAGSIRVKVYSQNNSVHCEIEDNGVGIHEGLIDKIFEPFFSTKDTGKGVGLGLTLCYEFLHRMGGSIDVKSALGKGSIFKITLPALNLKEAEG